MIISNFGFLSPYILPAVMGIISLIVGIICIAVSFKQIRKQIKLHNSITLVQLKSNKFFYLIYVLVITFFIFYIVLQMADSQSSEAVKMLELMSMKRIHTNIMLGFLLFMLAAVEFLLVVLLKSKCAVVDRGIYTGIRYLDWYHVHDYIIDEDKGRVVLSSDKYTFATLQDSTPPLKVSKHDIPKLKFILNKNKNKFSSFNEDYSAKKQ